MNQIVISYPLELLMNQTKRQSVLDKKSVMHTLYMYIHVHVCKEVRNL